MREDFKFYVSIFIAIVIICLLLILYAILAPRLSSQWNPADNIKQGISTNITWEDQAITPYGEPIQARNGTIKGHMPIQAYCTTLVMVLMDEKVVPIYYNGTMNKTHLIEMGDNVGIWMPNNSSFTITGISEGAHSITFLTFIDPYNFNNNIWQNGGPIGGSSQSFSIIMANDTQTVQEIKDRSFSTAQVNSITGQSNYSFISRSSSSNQVWSREKIRKGTVIEYYVNIGHYYVNGNTTNLPFKLIQLLDYEQVPVRYDSADLVYTGQTTNSESVTVPMSIKAPDTRGPHKLIILLSINPRQALDPVHGDARWEMQSMGINHVDINVL